MSERFQDCPDFIKDKAQISKTEKKAQLSKKDKTGIVICCAFLILFIVAMFILPKEWFVPCIVFSGIIVIYLIWFIANKFKSIEEESPTIYLSNEGLNLRVLNTKTDMNEAVNESKTRETVAWRNSSGEISCTADECDSDCADACPIYLNTEALELMVIQEFEKVIPLYRRVIELAPDFYDAWNNLAAAYAQTGLYKDALRCYAKAHELNCKKSNPVYGLALVNRDLINYDECLKWCDEYDKLTDDHGLDEVRSNVEARLGISKDPSIKISYRD